MTPKREDYKIQARRYVFGQVYYDLLKNAIHAGFDDIYLLRIEQFYPFPR